MNALGTMVKEHILGNCAFHVFRGACAPVAYGTDYFSNGIRLLCGFSPEFAELTSELARRFYAGDYGEAYDWDEHPLRGHEMGWYPTDWGDVLVVSNIYGTTMCMSYER